MRRARNLLLRGLEADRSREPSLARPRRCASRRREHVSRAAAVAGLLVTLIAALSITGLAKEFYVSPKGTPRGKGSLQMPWDLQTALNQPRGIDPGDTIWLRGGVYRGAFVSYLTGTATAPIVLRQYPGEEALLDRSGSDPTAQPALTVKGSWGWYWGFEITNSYENRSPASPFSGAVRPWRGDGIDVNAPDNRFINLVIHDCGSGIYDKQDRTEIYGCLLYFNGNNHFEHGLYIGNASGTKRVADNIIFDQAGFGIHCFSASPSSAQQGLALEGNAIFNSGTLWAGGNTVADVIVGGVTGVAAARIVLESNFLYASIGDGARGNGGVRMGYADRTNADLRLTNNFIVSREPLRVHWWQNVACTQNVIYSARRVIEIKTPDDFRRDHYQWDNNSYYTLSSIAARFSFDGAESTGLPSWKQLTGFDGRSSLNATARLSKGQVFIRPNRYEKKRASIVIFNWMHLPSITVDLSSVLAAGDLYEIRDVQNYVAAPVTGGVFRGDPVSVPMTMNRTAMPVGASLVPRHTAPEFAVFILQKASNLHVSSSGVERFIKQSAVGLKGQKYVNRPVKNRKRGSYESPSGR